MDYFVNMSDTESEGEDPRNLCEIDKMEDLCQNQGTDQIIRTQVMLCSVNIILRYFILYYITL